MVNQSKLINNVALLSRGYDLDTSTPTKGFSERCAKLPTNVKVRKY